MMASWRIEAEYICISHHVRLKDVLSKSRRAPLVKARQAIAIMLRARTDDYGRPWSYPRIGRLLHRDHTAILYLCKPDMKTRRKAKRILSREAA